MSDNPRAFIDMNGGYQSTMTGADKEAHDAWVQSNTWSLTRDDFIRLSYFHGDLEAGSNGLGPRNGSEDRPGDVVYISADKGVLTRSMVSSWLNDSSAFMHGYKKALAAQASPAKPSDIEQDGYTESQIEAAIDAYDSLFRTARGHSNKSDALIAAARVLGLPKKSYLPELTAKQKHEAMDRARLAAGNWCDGAGVEPNKIDSDAAFFDAILAAITKET